LKIYSIRLFIICRKIKYESLFILASISLIKLLFIVNIRELSLYLWSVAGSAATAVAFTLVILASKLFIAVALKYLLSLEKPTTAAIPYAMYPTPPEIIWDSDEYKQQYEQIILENMDV
jgi:hypothetical protein